MATAASTVRARLGRFGYFREPYKLAAYLGVAILTAASVRVLYDITVILGGSTQLLLRVSGAIALAWVVATYLSPRRALAVFATLAAVSFLWYMTAVSGNLLLIVTAPVDVIAYTISDSIAVATGLSVLTFAETDVWALSFAPAPLFLLWYFAFRDRFRIATAIGGATMAVFVLSGDLGWEWTLVGTLGGIAAVGFGTMHERGARLARVEWLVVVMVAMAIAATVIPVVPGGGALGPLTIVGSEDRQPEGQTIESHLVGSDERLQIVGEINLSPGVRYTIEGEGEPYWRTGIYDLYTGDGWVTTGDTSPVNGPLAAPPDGEEVVQAVRLETETTQLPAATTPVSVAGLEDVEVSDHGVLRASDTLPAGTTYEVASIVPQGTGTPTVDGVPESIADRYLQLPEDTPDRIGDLTEELVGSAGSIPEAATTIEGFLEQEKAYSLEVSVPESNVADTFIFGMDAGYCTYFATAMTAMLRSVDIPARMAVGYANGQQVAEDRWVLRGLNSHAWVEVYHPEKGWVRYDPTPAAPRELTRDRTIEDARSNQHTSVDTDESAGLPPDYDPTQTPSDDPNNETDTNESQTNDTSIIDPGGPDIVPPEQITDFEVNLEDYQVPEDESSSDDESPIDWRLVGFFGLVGVGAVVGGHRADLPGRIHRQVRHRWHLRRQDPQTDAKRTLERLEWVMAARYRPKRPGETWRTYCRLYGLSRDTEEIERVIEVCERCRYGGRCDVSAIKEAINITDDLVAEEVRLGGSIPRRDTGGDNT